MTASLNSPLDLCDRLGLTPTEAQYALLERFMADQGALDCAEFGEFEAQRAVAVCALWSLLRDPGSLVTVIADARPHAQRFMDFLHILTTRIDAALTQVCRWRNWRHMQVGNDPGHVLKALPNNPQAVQGLHATRHAAVILGASCDESRFSETREAMEAAAAQPGGRILRVW